MAGVEQGARRFRSSGAPSEFIWLQRVPLYKELSPWPMAHGPRPTPLQHHKTNILFINHFLICRDPIKSAVNPHALILLARYYSIIAMSPHSLLAADGVTEVQGEFFLDADGLTYFVDNYDAEYYPEPIPEGTAAEEYLMDGNGIKYYLDAPASFWEEKYQEQLRVQEERQPKGDEETALKRYSLELKKTDEEERQPKEDEEAALKRYSLELKKMDNTNQSISSEFGLSSSSEGRKRSNASEDRGRSPTSKPLFSKKSPNTIKTIQRSISSKEQKSSSSKHLHRTDSGASIKTVMSTADRSNSREPRAAKTSPSRHPCRTDSSSSIRSGKSSASTKKKRLEKGISRVKSSSSSSRSPSASSLLDMNLLEDLSDSARGLTASTKNQPPELDFLEFEKALQRSGANIPLSRTESGSSLRGDKSHSPKKRHHKGKKPATRTQSGSCLPRMVNDDRGNGDIDGVMQKFSASLRDLSDPTRNQPPELESAEFDRAAGGRRIPRRLRLGMSSRSPSRRQMENSGEEHENRRISRDSRSPVARTMSREGSARRSPARGASRENSARGGRRGGLSRQNSQRDRSATRSKYAYAIEANKRRQEEAKMEAQLAAELEAARIIAAEKEEEAARDLERQAGFIGGLTHVQGLTHGLTAGTKSVAQKSMSGLATVVHTGVGTTMNLGKAVGNVGRTATQVAAGTTMNLGKTVGKVGMSATQAAAGATFNVGKLAIGTTVGVANMGLNVTKTGAGALTKGAARVASTTVKGSGALTRQASSSVRAVGGTLTKSASSSLRGANAFKKSANSFSLRKSARNSVRSSTTEMVPRQVLLCFFLEATQALRSLNKSPDDHPVSQPECRSLLLEEQRSCLDRVVSEYNEAYSTQLTSATVQQALSSAKHENDPELEQTMVAMNDAARLAFARLVLYSECQRTGTTSLNNIHRNKRAEGPAEPLLMTSRMSRSAMLEFCALGVAATQLETVQAHIRDATVPFLVWNDKATSNGKYDNGFHNTNNKNDKNQPTVDSLKLPPMKRLENLQRLLLQAIGYDPDTALKELARQVQMEGNDDLELVQVIQQATASMMYSVLGKNAGNDSSRNTTAAAWRQPELLLSDQDDGGVTRVVSVQHSETLVHIEDPEEGGAAQIGAAGAATAPVSQSMRDDREDEGNIQLRNGHNSKANNINHQQQQQQLQMAREAAQLQQSLVEELKAMSEKDRQSLLGDAERAIQTFQQQVLERSPGPERIEFLQSMDANTKKLLTMHRIWQEEVAKK